MRARETGLHDACPVRKCSGERRQSRARQRLAFSCKFAARLILRSLPIKMLSKELERALAVDLVRTIEELDLGLVP